MTSIPDKPQARRMTLVARGVALVAVLAAGALSVAELPGLEPKPYQSSLPSEPTDADQPAGPPRHDANSIIASLAVHYAPPAKPEPAPADQGTSEGPGRPASGEPRYIGLIRLGSSPRAILVADGRQGVYRIGDQVGGAGELVAIEDSHVELRAGTRSRQVPLASRSGPRVATIAPPLPSLVNAPGDDDESDRLQRLRDRQAELERRREESRRGSEEATEGGP